MTAAGTFAKGTDVAKQFASEIKGKVILVTGVSPNSLGSQFVQTVAQHQPALVVLAGRTTSKLEETSKTLQGSCPTRTLQLDLSSQKQVRRAAKEVQGYAESIDVLFNNAGIMATPYSQTEDGIESQFGCNHVGHFLFTNLILSKLSPTARIVNVASDGYRLGPVRFQDYNFQEGKVYDKWRAYGQSKSANMLFSVAFSKRFREGKGSQMTCFSVHPGVIATGLGSHLQEEDFQALADADSKNGHPAYSQGFTFRNADEGTATHIYACFAPDIANLSGGYLEDCHVLPAEEIFCWGRDKVDAEKLWKLSEKLVGESF